MEKELFLVKDGEMYIKDFRIFQNPNDNGKWVIHKSVSWTNQEMDAMRTTKQIADFLIDDFQHAEIIKVQE